MFGSLFGRVVVPKRVKNSLVRTLFSKDGLMEDKYTKEVRIQVEQNWKDKLAAFDQEHIDRLKKSDKPKYYVLSMFPYPSGRLHMGHVRVYSISDAMARYHRLKGRNVIHPMGWDAFGLPAENAAIERKEQPDEWTYSNISHMKKQLEDLCFSFDWSSEFATCDADYYKWTQYIFLKMFESGLAYQREAPVHWDPIDKTVLADEQIDENNRSWRSGAKVERRFLRQWYIKTTAYSKALYDGLNKVNPDLWKDIIDLQKNWIGECNGTRIEFKLQNISTVSSVSIFTKVPEALYGVSHICISPEHHLNKAEFHEDEATGVKNSVIKLKICAVNPFSNMVVPIYVCNEKDFGEYLNASIGIPSLNTEDKEFADNHNLTYTEVYDDNGHLINSNMPEGLSQTEAFQMALNYAKTIGCGGDLSSERSRDWLISRQRYWGTPIPIIHCPKKGPVAVPYADLPITLPKDESFQTKDGSLWYQGSDWCKVKCPGCDCDSYGTRETDTMDTFVDSSWYFLRFLDSENQDLPFSKDKAVAGMPVDLYIGGKEHAIMHLYYARFFMHFLHEQGMVAQCEPFLNLLTQGMVMGRSYRLKNSNKYIPLSQVDTSGSKPTERETGEELIVDWEKMSKSKHNGVDPQTILEEHGSDSTRLCILSSVAPKSNRHWDEDAFVGIFRWQARLWSLVSDFVEQRQMMFFPKRLTEGERKQHEENIKEERNFYVKEIAHHFEKSFLLSTAISRLIGLTNALKKVPESMRASSAEYERALCDLVIMTAPFAPMIALELWSALQSLSHIHQYYNWDDNVLEQTWPVVDSDYRLNMKVKRNEREAFTIKLPMEIGQEMNLTKSAACALAESHGQFNDLIDSSVVKNVVFSNEPGFKVELKYEMVKKKKRRHNDK